MSPKEASNEVEETTKLTSKKVNLPPVKEFLPTGCSVLDFAISNRFPGGIPTGRIVHVFGATSTCKTVLATTVCGSAQRRKMKSYYGDIEHTLDPAFAEIYGLNCSDNKTFEVWPRISDLNKDDKVTIETFFDNWVSGIVTKDKGKKLVIDPKIIVVDSVTALPSEVELKEDMKDGSYGTSRAKQMSRGFRKYIFALAESNTTLFCIDQTRDNIGSLYKSETTSGGRALEFFASVQLYLKMDKKVENSSGTAIGHWVKFEVKKNKVAPPFRSGRFRVLFDYGLDNTGTNLYFISELQNGEREANKKTTKIELWNEKHTYSTWIKKIEDENLEDKLDEETWALWKEKYKSEPRKPRVWG